MNSFNSIESIKLTSIPNINGSLDYFQQIFYPFSPFRSVNILIFSMIGSMCNSYHTIHCNVETTVYFIEHKSEQRHSIQLFCSNKLNHIMVVTKMNQRIKYEFKTMTKRTHEYISLIECNDTFIPLN